MSKYSKNQYNKFTHLERLLHDIYSSAIICKKQHSEIIKSIKTQIWDNSKYAKLSQYYKGYISGIEKTLYKAHYANLEWRLLWKGIYYKTFTDLPKEAKDFLKKSNENSLGLYVYRSDNDKHF